MSQRVHGAVVKSLLNKKGGDVGSVVVDLGLRERKKLGQWMFFLFCGVCLFMGVFKICASGWFGSALERAASNQVNSLYASVYIVFFFSLYVGCLFYTLSFIAHTWLRKLIIANVSSDWIRAARSSFLLLHGTVNAYESLQLHCRTDLQQKIGYLYC